MEKPIDKSRDLINTKEKTTFNLSQNTLDSLEDAYLKLRRDLKNEHRVTKTFIVEKALEMALNDFESSSELSHLYDRIKQEKTSQQPSGRINPQLSCTITPEDKDLLNELTLYACNRERKVLNTSVLIRALIRLGKKYKEELSF